MKKLKNLFPISFKFSKSIPMLILCAAIYLLIELAAGFALGLLVQPILSIILETIFSPLTLIFGWGGYIIGILLCCTGIGAIIGIPMAIAAFFIILIPSTIVSIIMTVLCGIVSYYCIAGFVVAAVAYGGAFDKDE